MSDSEKHFDLTSAEGTKEAHDWASSAGQTSAVAASMGLLAAVGGAVGHSAISVPVGTAVYSAYKLIRRSLSAGEALKEQSEAASEIIKAGRDAGVKRMTVEIDNKAGLDIGSDIEGIPVRCMVGTKGKIRIEVEYD